MFLKALKEKAAASKQVAVKACAFVASGALALGLTGCMQGELSTKIEKNGSVKASATARIEKAPYDDYMKSAGSSKSEIADSVKGMDVKTIDGIQFYTKSENHTYANLNDFKKDLTSSYSAKKVYIATTDTIYYSYDADANSNSKIGGSSTEQDEKTMQALMTLYGAKTQYQVTYTYEFADKITDTNGKIDSKNPNKVTFTVKAGSMPKYIFATTTGKKKAYFDQQSTGKVTSSAKVTKAKKVSLSKKSLKAKVGKSYVIKVKNASKSAKWSVSNKNAAILKKSAKSVKIKAKKKGTTYVKCKVGSKTYKCKVTIKK